MQSTRNFILIDDSKMDLFLIEKLLKSTNADCMIQTFDKPDLALDYFIKHLPVMHYTVLLDINMPVINGFEFLEAFDKLTEDQKKHYHIYILTSSQNVTDIERGKSNKYVTDVLHKPLNKDTLLHLFNSIS